MCEQVVFWALGYFIVGIGVEMVQMNFSPDQNVVEFSEVVVMACIWPLVLFALIFAGIAGMLSGTFHNPFYKEPKKGAE